MSSDLSRSGETRRLSNGLEYSPITSGPIDIKIIPNEVIGNNEQEAKQDTIKEDVFSNDDPWVETP